MRALHYIGIGLLVALKIGGRAVAYAFVPVVVLVALIGGLGYLWRFWVGGDSTDPYVVAGFVIIGGPIVLALALWGLHELGRTTEENRGRGW